MQVDMELEIRHTSLQAKIQQNLPGNICGLQFQGGASPYTGILRGSGSGYKSGTNRSILD